MASCSGRRHICAGKKTTPPCCACTWVGTRRRAAFVKSRFASPRPCRQRRRRQWQWQHHPLCYAFLSVSLSLSLSLSSPPPPGPVLPGARARGGDPRARLVFIFFLSLLPFSPSLSLSLLQASPGLLSPLPRSPIPPGPPPNRTRWLVNTRPRRCVRRPSKSRSIRRV